jgi:hypothetical protein
MNLQIGLAFAAGLLSFLDSFMAAMPSKWDSLFIFHALF